VGDEAEILEDDSDPAAESRQAPARHGDDVLAEQFDQATARPLGEVEQSQERRLARARGPGEEIESALAQREAEVRQRLRSGPVAKADIVELDDRAGRAQNPPPLYLPDRVNGMAGGVATTNKGAAIA
jgi:hypothetical protein